MELVTMRNILSTSSPFCIWSSRREQLPRSRKPLQAAFVTVRKEMSPLLEFPDDKNASKKEARNKKLSDLKKALKAKKDIAIKKA
jgi:hypothetical protein